MYNQYLFRGFVCLFFSDFRLTCYFILFCCLLGMAEKSDNQASGQTKVGLTCSSDTCGTHAISKMTLTLFKLLSKMGRV